MKKPYPYIVAWGKFMGSTESYIDQEVRIAVAAVAPENAIYMKADKTWATYDDIKSPSTREEVDLCLRTSS